MESFKIESLKETINVNGVDLVFHFDDNEFLKKINDFQKLFEKKSIDLDVTDKIGEKINDIFGENTCKDIFGVEHPSVLVLIELCEYIGKIVKNFTTKREASIKEKYNAEREGDV